MDDTTAYEIRVRGALSERLISAFPEMHAQAEERETVLTGTLPDQAALHGVLGRIEALGLDLLEVHRPKGTGPAPIAPADGAPGIRRAPDGR